LTARCGVVGLLIMSEGPIVYIGAITGTAALAWSTVVWVIERRTKASVSGGYIRFGIEIRVVNRCSHQIQVVCVGATDKLDHAAYSADVSSTVRFHDIGPNDPLQVVDGPSDIGPWREEKLLLKSPQLTTRSKVIWDEWLHGLENVHSAGPEGPLQGPAHEIRVGSRPRGKARCTVWIQVAAGKRFSGPLRTSSV
jgi:hypothetical protein